MASGSAQIIWKGSEQYESVRVGRLFNHIRPERYPRGVLEATSVQQIVDAVKLAKELKVQISVRSGGHSWAAWSVREDAILIDLGKFKIMEFNENETILKASPSITGRELDGYLSTKGKMFPGGHCPDVGLGGFLLQGGMGWNTKNWGWACERVVAVEVVTADGEALLCNKEQNSDLYWAARGAGPGFPAVVTAFYLEVRNGYSAVRASTFQWPLSDYKTVLDWAIQIAPKCDEAVEVVCVAYRPDSSKEIVIRANFVTFKNTEKEAIDSLKLINDTRPPGAIMESINRVSSLSIEYDFRGAANPEGHRYACDNAYIDNNVNVSKVLEAAFCTMPEGSKTTALWFSMNPCSRRPLSDMALSMHSDHYLGIYSIWEDEKDDYRCKSWVKEIMTGVEKHSIGAYLGDADFQVRRSKYWRTEQWEKLMGIRRKWDSKGIICGYLDEGDKSGLKGLENVHEWQV